MYTDEERKIFRFRNGTLDAEGKLRVVCGDPLELDRRFLAACLEQDLQTYVDRLAKMFEADAQSAGSEPRPDPLGTKFPLIKGISDTVGQIVPIVRDVFGIQPLNEDGVGLTESETLEVLSDFMLSKSEVKKNTEESLSSSAPTDGPPEGSDTEPPALPRIPSMPPLPVQAPPPPEPEPVVQKVWPAEMPWVPGRRGQSAQA
jgi:hypothetical protein